jgi:hypothetical protein
MPVALSTGAVPVSATLVSGATVPVSATFVSGTSVSADTGASDGGAALSAVGIDVSCEVITVESTVPPPLVSGAPVDASGAGDDVLLALEVEEDELLLDDDPLVVVDEAEVLMGMQHMPVLHE